MTGTERAALAELDERFESDAWLAGPALPASPNGAPVARQVKVRAGVWTLAATRDGASVAAALVKGRVHEVRVYDRELDGRTDRAEQSLVGLPLTAVAPALAAFGDPGRRLAAAFSAADARDHRGKNPMTGCFGQPNFSGYVSDREALPLIGKDQIHDRQGFCE